MQETVRRIFIEKKPGFNVEAINLLTDFRENLGIKNLNKLRIVNRYDVQGITDEVYQLAQETIFCEPPVDYLYEETLPIPENEYVLAVEPLPGQYDQRADYTAQALQLLSEKTRPSVVTAKILLLAGDLTNEDIEAIKQYYINPVESRIASLNVPKTLMAKAGELNDVKILNGFIDKDETELAKFLLEKGLAMKIEDLLFCQKYFRDTEKRDPTITELKVIDTYWSDHCRHTTFMTAIEQVTFDDMTGTEPIKMAFANYQDIRKQVYGDQKRDMCLMDIAVIAMKEMRKSGKLDDLDVSEEINACSIVVQADIDGKTEDWLVMFKNETHNHPTEIEPFGGASTCLGGAIRDPLSGRSYVYQAMRVTGSGDPRTKVADTIPGKLPQRKITTTAAQGYSSYGNQIGAATGHVAEIYDEAFIAKRMEVGAVIAAAPKENVVREQPIKGDVVILAGGRTGRDGCGGATGSSREHDEDSAMTSSAEVQKGNPIIERGIQRLFRDPQVSKMIKRCNDFGAGGVSVAIGELTDGLHVNLDAVPTKYPGLDGTELAISESQERMAVVVAADNAAKFIEYANKENVEATIVAEVTDNRRLQMFWRGQAIVDLSRDFLDTNGVKQTTLIHVAAPDIDNSYFVKTSKNIGDTSNVGNNDNSAVKNIKAIKEAWKANLADLNVCSQRGIIEQFDSSVGAGTVLMPLGGKYQSTPAEGMVAKLPVIDKNTTTATILTHGYNPKLATWSPFHGALYAVVEAVAKVVAIGGDYRTTRLTLQEYFERLGDDPTKWGKPFSALLGALQAQMELGIPAIGGKDSMSGTFKDLDVPPTLIAFAVDVVNADNVISPEFKQPGSQVVVIEAHRDEQEVVNFEQLKINFDKVMALIKAEKVLAAHTVKYGGLAEAITKMAFGNRIGVKIENEAIYEQLFAANYGSIVLELDSTLNIEQTLQGISYQFIGHTIEQPTIIFAGLETAKLEANSDISVNSANSETVDNNQLQLDELYHIWTQPLETVFPTTYQPDVMESFNEIKLPPLAANDISILKSWKAKVAKNKIAKPKVVIPVLPGTNGEYDSQLAFTQAGGEVETVIIRNLTEQDIQESIQELIAKINDAQILMLAGGAVGGNEPDGPAKMYAALFQNKKLQEAVMSLISAREGLILGIGNGFQALVKLGLLPYGEFCDSSANSPIFTYNLQGKHISQMVNTKFVTDKSPWLSNIRQGDIYKLPISTSTGRLVAPIALLDRLQANGQIVSQYVDNNGKATYDIDFNPTGSMYAIEGLISKSGQILGKMGHTERLGEFVAKNIPNIKDQQLFSAGIKYFQ